MTIPKPPENSGLSHLADAARRDGEQILHSYPMKKKGEPRRLLPNRAGIEWLESDANDFDDDTDIEYAEPMRDAESVNILHSYGRERKRYARPMFQIIPRDAFSGAQQNVTPCSCDRFDLSWDATRCETHAEVEWDTVEAPAAVPLGERLNEMYEQMIAITQGRCQCASCRAGRGDDPSGPRVVRRGDAPDGRWFFSPETQAAEARRQAALERQRQIYAATDPNRNRPGWGYSNIADRWVADMPDFTMTLEGTFNPSSFSLEVSGETVQGIQSFSIEVEPNNDDTR